MKKEFLECGKIVSTHGIKGEVKAQPWSNTPEELTELSTFYFAGGEQPVEVERARVHKNMLIIKLVGVDTPEQAAALRNKTLYLRRDEMPLGEGECFVQDLIGCTVIDADTGANYGKVYDVRETGANDVYYLKDEQGVERLVPAIPQVVLKKDIDAGIVEIRPLEGLFDDAH